MGMHPPGGNVAADELEFNPDYASDEDGRRPLRTVSTPRIDCVLRAAMRQQGATTVLDTRTGQILGISVVDVDLLFSGASRRTIEVEAVSASQRIAMQRWFSGIHPTKRGRQIWTLLEQHRGRIDTMHLRISKEPSMSPYSVVPPVQ